MLNGNPSKIDLKEREAREPKPRKKIPHCPKHLDKWAKAEWKRMAPILLRLGVLTEADGTALAAYCQLYSRWVQLENRIQNVGDFMLEDKQHPLIVASRQTLQLLRSFCTEFGMTPSARGRMVAPGEKEDDDFSGILDG